MKTLISSLFLLSSALLAQGQLGTLTGPVAGSTIPIGSTVTFAWTANTYPAPPSSARYYVCVNTVHFDTINEFCPDPNSLGAGTNSQSMDWPMIYQDPGNYNPIFVTFWQSVFDSVTGWTYTPTYIQYQTTPASVVVMTDAGGTGNPLATPGDDDYSDPQDPYAVLVYPNSGSGPTQAFTFLAQDEAGWQDISYIVIQFGSGDSNCTVNWVPAGIFIGFSTPIPLGSNQIWHGPNCDILGSQSSETLLGNNITLTLGYSFSSSMVGTQNIYMNVVSKSGLPSPGYQLLGTWTPNPTSGTDSMTTHKTFITKHGEAINIKRGDVFKTSPAVQYSYTPGAGSNSYSYTFDNSEVAHIRLGIVPEDTDIGDTSSSQPKGWLRTGPGWHRWTGAENSKTAQYVVTSTKRPGLMPLFLQNDWDGMGAKMNGQPIPDDAGFTGIVKHISSREESRLNAEINIFENSRQEFVIGPAFKPEDTMADVMKRVKIWARSTDGYGFTFLEPLVAAANPKSVLDSLSPSTQLERDIVSSLRTVFAIAK